jgi:hypothetical protein
LARKIRSSRCSLAAGFPKGTGGLVLRKAYANEYGTAGSGIRSTDLSESIPARPFLAMSVPRIAHEAVAVIANKGLSDVRESMDDAGRAAVEAIKDTISMGSFAPNSDYTKKKKNGGDTPLVDTGEMAVSVSYRVRE